jgi:hypothetical protein
MTFKVCKYVHHHTIQINQQKKKKKFSSLLLDVYEQINMFRTAGPTTTNSTAITTLQR